MTVGARTFAQLNPQERAAGSSRSPDRQADATRREQPRRAVDPRVPRRAVDPRPVPMADTLPIAPDAANGNGHQAIELEPGIRRGPEENGNGNGHPRAREQDEPPREPRARHLHVHNHQPGADTIIGYQTSIRYWKRSVSMEPLRDFVVYVGGTLLEWSPLVEAAGSEYDLHPHSHDLIMLKPADRVHGVAEEMPSLPAHILDGIRRVNDDVYCCCCRMQTSDPARTLPALQAAWQVESAQDNHRLTTSRAWVDRFLALLDGEEELAEPGHPNFHASLRLQLTRPGFPMEGPQPQLHWDRTPYTPAEEQVRRNNYYAWMARRDLRQDTERCASGAEMITYFIDGNHSRDTSCVCAILSTSWPTPRYSWPIWTFLDPPRAPRSTFA